MSNWKTIETAPKDGTWILLRGRNMARHEMIPVVAAYRPNGSPPGCGWVDSGTFKNCDTLAADKGADWHPLPTD